MIDILTIFIGVVIFAMFMAFLPFFFTFGSAAAGIMGAL